MLNKKNKKLMVRVPPKSSKEFTTTTPKLRDAIYEHGTSKAAARNIKAMEVL